MKEAILGKDEFIEHVLQENETVVKLAGENLLAAAIVGAQGGMVSINGEPMEIVSIHFDTGTTVIRKPDETNS